MRTMAKKDYFDQYAETWDQMYHQDNQRQLEELFNYFSLDRGTRVLDVGSGTGILIPSILKAVGESGEIIALDFSWKMLYRAKVKDFGKNVSFVTGDVENLPFEDKMYDCVVCFACFAHFDNQAKSLREMSRVLKTKGRLFIAHLLSREELTLHHQEAGGEVTNDVLPEDSQMEKMFVKVGFEKPKIIDQPSLYLASGIKK